MSDELLMTPQIGDVVRYSDMANPGNTYVIVGIEGSNYKLVAINKPYKKHESDLRQYGWRVYRGSVDNWFKLRPVQNV
jgi:hypothetical protein